MILSRRVRQKISEEEEHRKYEKGVTKKRENDRSKNTNTEGLFVHCCLVIDIHLKRLLLYLTDYRRRSVELFLTKKRFLTLHGHERKGLRLHLLNALMASTSRKVSLGKAASTHERVAVKT